MQYARNFYMLKQRFITAVILAAVFLSLIIFASDTVFKWAILAVIAVVGWEWVRLSISEPKLAHYLVFIAPLLTVCFLLKWPAEQFVITFCVVWLFLFACVFTYPKSSGIWNTSVMLYVIGWLVLSLTFWAVVTVREDAGSGALISIIILTAAADIGAYAFGKKWGKHKLAPKVSPGKTWQGYLGGLISVTLVIVAIVFLEFGASYVSAGELLILISFGVVFHMLSVLGDLTESMLKRTRGLKDSSNILPGHGGVLDRVDALLVVIPFVVAVYYAIELIWLR